MTSIQDRAFSAINLAQFKSTRYPEVCGSFHENELDIPKENQKVLRLLIEEPYSNLVIPEPYKWALPIIREGKHHQKKIGVKHPFVYLTIRHGIVDTIDDDVWHTDGFSTNITHVPEQNYIWMNKYPSEYIVDGIVFPEDFNPAYHNVHLYIQDVINNKSIISGKDIPHLNPYYIYALDPYVVHRRPKGAFNKHRTFVRVSFTPIEIMDKNNTINPDLPRSYKRDGVADFRDKLFRYEVI